MFGVKLKAVQKYSVEQIDFELGKLSSQIMNADFKIVELEEALLLATDNAKKNKILNEIKKVQKKLKVYRQEEAQFKELKKEALSITDGKKFNLDT